MNAGAGSGRSAARASSPSAAREGGGSAAGSPEAASAVDSGTSATLSSGANNGRGELEGSSASPAAHAEDEVQLICRRCGATVTRRNNVIPHPQTEASIGQREEGRLGLTDEEGHTLFFKNPAGAEFEVAAVSRATVKNVGSQSPADSFYDGYKWRMTTCSSCGEHLGWEFEQIGQKRRMTEPELAAADEAENARREAREAIEAAEREAEAAGAGKKRAAASKAGKKRKGSAAGGAAGSSEEELQPAEPLPIEQISDDKLASFENVCMTFPRGWWTFEWCYNQYVRQFHREPSGEITADFMLGTYDLRRSRDANRKVKEWLTLRSDEEWAERLSGPVPTAAPVSEYNPIRIPYLSSVYTKGQPCDELGGRGRSAEVRHRCCPRSRNAHIEAIDEPALCRYQVTVCSPELCKPRVAKPAPAKGAGKADKADKGRPSAAKGGSTARESTKAAQNSRSRTSRARKAQSVTVYDESKPRKFVGLLWNKIVAEDDEDLWWIEEVKPITSITR